MKIVVISDTHGKHREYKSLPEGDILVHCGDFSNIGEKQGVEDFMRWFVDQPHKYKVFIAGNHDRSFDPKFNPEPNPYWEEEYRALHARKPIWVQDLLKDLKKLYPNVFYLEDEGCEIEGIKFWGSPWTPDFHPQYWAFNKPRGAEIKKIWDQIPMDINILITHGPCAHKLDWCKHGELVGCHDLTYAIQMIKPKYHLFGHIHESFGQSSDADTLYINASSLDERYTLKNKPFVIDYE